MKVGTDSVLIGAWSDVSSARRALDVGTGCGVIALMLAQRGHGLKVDAVDIDHDSIVEANGNFTRSPWGDRVNAIEGDFTAVEYPEKYDLIVSNPPFFTNGVLPSGMARMNARHTCSLTYRDLLTRAKSLLADAGKIAIVSPVDASKEILEVCGDILLYVSKVTFIVPIEGMEPKRILWEFTPLECHTERNTLVIEKIPGEYTEEFRALCRDFYLKF